MRKRLTPVAATVRVLDAHGVEVARGKVADVAATVDRAVPTLYGAIRRGTTVNGFTIEVLATGHCLGSKWSTRSPQAVPVIRDGGKRYASMTLAAKAHGVTHRGIGKACETGGLSGGRRWRYAEDLEFAARRLPVPKRNRSQRRKAA